MLFNEYHNTFFEVEVQRHLVYIPSFLVCLIKVGILLKFPFFINSIGFSGINGSFLTCLASIIGSHGVGVYASQSFKKSVAFAISEALSNHL